MKPANTDNRHRVTIASYGYGRRRELERVGYVMESGTLQEYVMRQDFPGAEFCEIDEPLHPLYQ
ncbi:MAG TPA: hypothetical protein VMV19_08250 [Xanthobacteraceae bacterium]|nr:hypothetical protein [Xanthobacteraceae bacterium]